MSIRNILLIITAVTLFFVSIAAFASPQQEYLDYQRVKQEKKALADYVVATTKNSRKPVTLSKSKQIINKVYEYAGIHGTDPLLVLAMIRTESTFSDKAMSKYGAKGLLQIVPRFHQDKLQKRNPYDINTNVDVGIQILKEYLAQHNNKLKPALRKYSGGANRYHTKVSKNYSEMARHLVKTAFENEQPITVVYNIEKPQVPPNFNNGTAIALNTY